MMQGMCSHSPLQGNKHARETCLNCLYCDCSILSMGIATPRVRSEVLFFPHRKNEQSGAGGRSATPAVKKWCHDFDLTRDMSEEQLSRAQLVCTNRLLNELAGRSLLKLGVHSLSKIVAYKHHFVAMHSSGHARCKVRVADIAKL